jgi:hypothetical protein
MPKARRTSGRRFWCDLPYQTDVCVGDLFDAWATGPRGRREGTRSWVVLAIRGNAHHLLGLNVKGEVVSTSTYGAHVMQYRPRIGRLKAVPAFTAALIGDLL